MYSHVCHHKQQRIAIRTALKNTTPKVPENIALLKLLFSTSSSLFFSFLCYHSIRYFESIALLSDVTPYICCWEWSCCWYMYNPVENLFTRWLLLLFNRLWCFQYMIVHGSLILPLYLNVSFLTNIFKSCVFCLLLTVCVCCVCVRCVRTCISVWVCVCVYP